MRHQNKKVWLLFWLFTVVITAAYIPPVAAQGKRLTPAEKKANAELEKQQAEKQKAEEKKKKEDLQKQLEDINKFLADMKATEKLCGTLRDAVEAANVVYGEVPYYINTLLTNSNVFLTQCISSADYKNSVLKWSAKRESADNDPFHATDATEVYSVEIRTLDLRIEKITQLHGRVELHTTAAKIVLKKEDVEKTKQTEWFIDLRSSEKADQFVAALSSLYKTLKDKEAKAEQIQKLLDDLAKLP